MDLERNCHIRLANWHDMYQARVATEKGYLAPRDVNQVAGMFPYAAVNNYYRAVGKHFVAPRVLDELTRLYQCVSQIDSTSLHSAGLTRANASSKILLDFLDCCLDKHFGTYDYKSYIGLRLFIDDSLPADTCFSDAVTNRLSLLKLLLYDVYMFEARSWLGDESATQERSNHAVMLKRMDNIVRCLHVLNRSTGHIAPPSPEEQAALSMLERVPGDKVTEHDVETRLALVEMLHQAACCGGGTVPIDLLLRLSMMPVYVNHEEYNFIRVLQAFEVVFNIIISGLQVCINAVYDQRLRDASRVMARLCEIFSVDLSLFRILVTMQPEDFRIFRTYTEGASAIQSPQYKMIEVLMGTPSRARRESPAFKYVPQIRIFLERTGMSLDKVIRERVRSAYEGLSTGRPTDAHTLLLFQGINRLDNMFLDWKKRHFGVANRMLGDTVGTGGADVINYLGRFKGELFFPELDRLLGEAPVSTGQAGVTATVRPLGWFQSNQLEAVI